MDEELLDYGGISAHYQVFINGQPTEVVKIPGVVFVAKQSSITPEPGLAHFLRSRWRPSLSSCTIACYVPCRKILQNCTIKSNQ